MKMATRSGSEKVRGMVAAVLVGIAVLMMVGAVSGKKKRR